MKRKIFYVLILLNLFFFKGCKKENDPSNSVEIKTDALNYNSKDLLAILIKNNSELTLHFETCNIFNSNPKPLMTIEKYGNNKWTVFSAPRCDNFMYDGWFGQILKHTHVNDSLRLDSLSSGLFRVRYEFEKRIVTNQFEEIITDTCYSNEFNIR